MIRDELLNMRDEEYAVFMRKLMPTVPEENVIGIRVPQLRSYAKSIKNTDEANAFLKDLPHRYYEENNLHAYLVETKKDFNEAVTLVDAFLPYVDNWATCDSMSPKCFGKHPQELMEYIKKWIVSDKVYTVRFAVGMLMGWFLDDNFNENQLEMVAAVKSDEYYVNMMCAWYFATALAKQYGSTVKLLEENRLSADVHNKTIRKAVESFRITPEQKTYLKTLKRNEKK